MTDSVGEFCNIFQIVYTNSSWLLATCSWHYSNNYSAITL